MIEKDRQVKVTYFDKPVAVPDHPSWWHAEFFRPNFRRLTCEHRIAQKGLDAAGRRRRPRRCLNDAVFMRYDRAAGWHRPLCKIHWTILICRPAHPTTDVRR